MAHVLSEHHVFLLLIQFSLILFVARIAGELMQRLGQPTVLGELLAGVVLGPSILGYFWPQAYGALFPNEQLSFNLLEMLAWLGMIFLLFLTGLETDIKVLRHLGKPTFRIATTDLIFTFSVGTLLGYYLPHHFQGELQDRRILSLFVGLAMSITAIPVLAKILMELGLIKRNFGLAVLGAGIVEDLAGWIGLSIILDLAHKSRINFGSLIQSLVITVLFVVFAWTVGRRLIAYLFVLTDDKSRLGFRRVTLAAGVALVGAVLTQWIGIHALFGAFIAGLLVGQSDRFVPKDREIMEGFTYGVISPIFFSFAGLQVRLHELRDWGFFSVLLLAAIACKLIGGYMGGRFGKFKVMESVAMGIGLNARGAMELVLALLGLSAGIISHSLFSMIVMVAVITSLLTPPLLKAVSNYIPLNEDEEERIRQQSLDSGSFFKKKDLRILIPSRWGLNTQGILSFAAPLSFSGRAKLTLFVVRSAGRSLKEKLLKLFRMDEETQRLVPETENLKTMAKEYGLTITPKVATGDSVADAILSEASSAADLLLMGVHSTDDPFGGDTLELITADGNVATAICKFAPFQPSTAYKKILIPTKGDTLFPFVFEFACLYAESVSNAALTVFYVAPKPKKRLWYKINPTPALVTPSTMQSMIGGAIQSHMEPQTGKLNIEQKTVEAENIVNAILNEAKTGNYDLVIMGGTKHLVREKLFFGYKIEALMQQSACPFILVTPQKNGPP